jgi:hypothetical protein
MVIWRSPKGTITESDMSNGGARLKREISISLPDLQIRAGGDE